MMGTDEQPLQIIGNESNMVYEIEPGQASPAQEPATALQDNLASEEPAASHTGNESQLPSNDLATNDGSIIETLDTAFHQKPGVAEGENPSGSNRAGYYEERAGGQSDAAAESTTSAPSW